MAPTMWPEYCGGLQRRRNEVATVIDKFRAIMWHGDTSLGIPVLEWAIWWKETVQRWQAAGAPATEQLQSWFGLDPHSKVVARPRAPGCPRPASYGAAIVHDGTDYARLLPHLFQLPSYDTTEMTRRVEAHARGEGLLWLTLEGPFWFPRTLLGIHEHLLAFYDNTELMIRMNEDLIEFNIRALEDICQYYTPDFVTIAEDMSFNHGPMISYQHMDRFMAPYYQRIMPLLKKRGIISLVDSDGLIEPLIPWFQNMGVDGMLPLERMAGVDVCRIRVKHPTFRMLGGFDKTVMHRGPAAIAAELQRIKPAVLGGYYIPSCDHQTPPAVSIADYRDYVSQLRRFSEKLVR